MAGLKEILVLASLFVGTQAATCYNYYYHTYSYCSSYYSYYYSNSGGIVGSIVGGLFGLGTLITLIVLCVCCRRRQGHLGSVFSNRPATAVTMVTTQTAGMASYPQPAPEQPGYLNPPEGQFGTVPPPVGTYAPPTQPTYPTGTQPYPQQAPPYSLGNTYDPNTAPMAGGGAYTNQGFQAPPSYDTVTSGKQ